MFGLFNKADYSKNKIRPVMLLIFDGWGIAPPSPGNAISQAKTPKYDELLRTYPSGSLIASGESVGLPANEVGNTEVGHLTMGVGRVISQDLVRIDDAISNESFYVNPALIAMEQHVKQYNSTLHLLGLVGTGNVHSSAQHFNAVLEFCVRKNISKVMLHLFTDGRDSDPKSGAEVIKNIEQYVKARGIGNIVTVSGRYYAMDRDRRWERTKQAYDAIVSGKGVEEKSAVEGVERSYQAGKTDEFIEPIVVHPEGHTGPFVNDNDALFLVNFRVDRPRQIAMALTMQDFESSSVSHPAFKRELYPKNLFVATMTQYEKKLPVQAIAFGPQVISDSLPAVLSGAGLKQMHMSESEKERFVTYYFRGMNENTYEGEDVLITPSPKVPTYDRKPEMSFPEQVKNFKKQLSKDQYHFFVMNAANADMVAHSGNLQSTILGCEAVDRGLTEIADAILSANGTLIITADHGNAEQMLQVQKTSFFVSSGEGKVITDHTNNPVPVIVARKGLENQKVGQLRGALADIAPTILAVMGIPAPKTMTGKNLLT